MSEINEIRRRFQNDGWPKFIKKITLDKLRGWGGQTVQFRFPICVIAGENGSGKSTVLRALVCAYENVLPGKKTFFPSQLFLKTQWDENSVPRDTLITYETKEGTRNSQGKWKRTNDLGYSPKGKRPRRAVVFLDISRTLPLDATAGYAKIAKAVADAIGSEVTISDDLMTEYSHIMSGRYPIGRFIQPVANRDLGLVTREFGEISQFHQGAGEDALLDLMRILQTIPDTALLVIDEVDASLHPKAQRRLIRFLMKLTRQKKLQVVLSTHSPYILDEIPPEGRILIQKLSDGNRDVQYRISTNYAMGLIDDERHPDLYIYVEDKEAKVLVHEIIKSESEVLNRVEIREVGDAETVKTVGRLCRNNKLPDYGIAVLDGDTTDQHGNCLSLPSDKAPEILVFHGLKEKGWKSLDSRFGMGAGDLYSIFEDAITNPDHHKIASQIGDRIGKSKDSVWEIFVEEWCKQCLISDDKERILTRIREALAEIDAND